MDIRGILDTIPHRYPFLLLDRVLELEPDRRIVAIKNVTINEPFFRGHFPGIPVMPGVLIVEAMAQASAVMLLSEMPEREKRLFYFAGIDKARFRRPVTPGDRLTLIVEILKHRARSVKVRGRAEVDGELAAEAEILSAMVDR